MARYQGWDAPYAIEQAKEFVTTMATAQTDVPGDWLQIAVARTGDGSLVGDVRWLHRRNEARTVEIGFTIAPERQGRGYARGRLIGPALLVRSARYAASPLPVLLHILCATVFTILGCLSVLAGRAQAVARLAPESGTGSRGRRVGVALSALWLNQFLPTGRRRA